MEVCEAQDRSFPLLNKKKENPTACLGRENIVHICTYVGILALEAQDTFNVFSN